MSSIEWIVGVVLEGPSKLSEAETMMRSESTCAVLKVEPTESPRSVKGLSSARSRVQTQPYRIKFGAAPNVAELATEWRMR